jgi:hypothetical protein
MASGKIQFRAKLSLVMERAGTIRRMTRNER